MDFKRKIKCTHCNKINDINLKDYIIDENSYEREMGSEIEYSVSCDGFICQYCNDEFSIKGSIWEYPEGCFNDEEIHVK